MSADLANGYEVNDDRELKLLEQISREHAVTILTSAFDKCILS